jgi:hypothetical protein
MLTNTQFQYKQTLLYSVDPLCLLLRLGNKHTFSLKNRKLLRVKIIKHTDLHIYIHKQEQQSMFYL